MEKIKVTAVIKTYNSEKTICDTLESLNLLDEIIAIDEHSSDDTLEFLKEYKTKVVYSTKGELQKSFDEALAQAQNEWVFVVADNEIVPKKTLDNINNYINKEDKKKKNTVSFIKKTMYLGRELKCAKNKHDIRLFKKDHAKLKNNWSLELTPLKSKTHKSKDIILEYDKTSISDKLKSNIEQIQLKLKQQKKSSASIFILPIIEFIRWYFIKAAFLDGRRGLIFSINKMIYCYIFKMMIFEKNNERFENDI